jgi:hypothetical protein
VLSSKPNTPFPCVGQEARLWQCGFREFSRAKDHLEPDSRWVDSLRPRRKHRNVFKILLAVGHHLLSRALGQCGVLLSAQPFRTTQARTETEVRQACFSSLSALL